MPENDEKVVRPTLLIKKVHKVWLPNLTLNLSQTIIHVFIEPVNNFFVIPISHFLILDVCPNSSFAAIILN